MAFPPACRLALKEWAVTLLALDRGEQVLLLRKGGIHEEGKEFRVLYPQFLIYPTYEHQREDLLKPHYLDYLRQTLAEHHDPAHITFSHWASVEEAIEVTEQRKVDDLSPHYIWTREYAEKRLHWKPRKPLLIALVRLYRLETPRNVPYIDGYAGCKSWVNLNREVPLGTLTPVLSDEAFRARAEQVRAALGLAPAPH